MSVRSVEWSTSKLELKLGRTAECSNFGDLLLSLPEMSKFNDLDLENWRECGVNTDSLWLIQERTKTGKHKNVYHGNFIPQIPDQLIRRYTKKEDVVFEPFAGSGTTLFVCEELGRKYIGLDINPEMIHYIENNRDQMFGTDRSFIKQCDSAGSYETASAVFPRFAANSHDRLRRG